MGHLENIEAVIGPAEHLVVTEDARKNLEIWAFLKLNISMSDVSRLSNVDLANMYHEHGPRAIPLPVGPVTGNVAEFFRYIERHGFAPLPRDEIISLIKEHAVPDATRIEIVEPGQQPRPLEGLHHHKTAEVIQCANLGDDIMMVGPAGCGKTTIGKAVSTALNLAFYITSTVFDTFELMGFIDGHGQYHRTPFRDAFEMGGVWVADEIDAWDAAALLAVNSALANGYATFPDNQIPVNRHPSFRVIACANTFGTGADRVYIGRNQLDAASLDRFAMIEIDYDQNLEMRLSNNPGWVSEIWNMRAKVAKKNIRHVVSTRAIIKGSRALTAGMDIERVREIYVFKGISDADRKKIVDNTETA